MATTNDTTTETGTVSFDIMVEMAAGHVAAKERDAAAREKAAQEDREREALERFRTEFDGYLTQVVLDAGAVRYSIMQDTYNGVFGRAVLTIDGEEWKISEYRGGMQYVGPGAGRDYAYNIGNKATFQTELLAAVAKRRKQRLEEMAEKARLEVEAERRTRETQDTASAAPEPREFPRTLTTNYDGRTVALSIHARYGDVSMIIATLADHGGVTFAAIHPYRQDEDEDGRSTRAYMTLALTADALDALDVARAEWKAELARRERERAAHRDPMMDMPF